MTHSNRGLMVVVSLSVLLASLGTSIVNIVLPALTTYFSADLQTVQWVVIAYLLSITVFVMFSGKLADRYGYRRTLFYGLAVFTISSLASVFATNIWLLILLRAIQGVGAAVLSTVSLVVVKNNTERERTGRAMGLIGTLSAMGTAMGPSIGGLLLSGFGWRSVFGLLAILGTSTFLLGLKVVPREKHGNGVKQEMYVADVLLFALAVSSYAIAMTFSRDRLNVYSLISLLVSGILSWKFFLRQKRSKSPLIDTGIMKNKVLIDALSGNFLVSSVMMATLIVGPFFLSLGLLLSGKMVGLIMSAGPVVSIITGVPSGRLVDKLGTELTRITSLVLLLAGTLCLALLPAIWGWPGYVAGIVVLTPGYQLFQAANNTAVMSAAAQKQEGTISGILNLARNTGLVTGASLMGALFSISARSAPVPSGNPGAMFFGLKITFLFAFLLLLAPLLKACISKHQPSTKD